MRSVILFLKQIDKRFRLQLILVAIFGLLNSVFQGVGILLIIPLIELYSNDAESSSWIVQFIERFGSSKDLTFLLGIYFSVLTVVAIFKSGYTYFTTYVTSRLGAEYAVEAFRDILKANWSFYIKYPASKLINLFKTESRAIRTMTMFFFKLIQSGLMIIIQLTLAFMVSWKLTLVSILILGVLYLVQTLFFQKNRNIGSERIWINEQVQRMINEVFQAIKFLKLHQQEFRKSEEFKVIHFESRDNELKKSKVDVISDLIFTVMGAGVIVGVIYFGLTYEWVTISSIIVLLVLLSRSISQVQNFTKSFNFFYNQLPSFENFHHLLQEAKSYPVNRNTSTSNKQSDAIEWKNVHFSYDKTPLIANKNYRFEKGKMYLLFGPSGAGKTTTLDLISGLIKPQQGIIEPQPIPKFSYVLQETLLFAGTVRENICLGENHSDEHIHNCLKLVGLSAKIKQLENGIDTLIKENATNFSGGEKQRLALARALITQPQVLLLDEFTSALDAPTESEIMDNLQELKKDRIIIIVSHRERTKDWVDEVISFL